MILRNVLGLSAVGRIQESALLDDWLYGGYIEGCVDVVGPNKERIIGGGGAKIALHFKVFVGRCNIIIVWASIVGSKQLA